MDRRRTLAFAAVLAACVGCDQAAKHVATSALAGAPPVSLLGDVLRLELAHNPGAFLGLGALLPAHVRLPLLLLAVPAGLALVMVLALRARPSGATLFGLALVAGGGLGNWLDRLLHAGTVTDFVSMGLGPLRTGIFNVADVAIVAGVALLVALQSRGRAADETPIPR